MSSFPISIPHAASASTQSSPASSYDSSNSASRILTYSRDELLALASSPLAQTAPQGLNSSISRSLSAFPEIMSSHNSIPNSSLGGASSTSGGVVPQLRAGRPSQLSLLARRGNGLSEAPTSTVTDGGSN